jgi:AcrR family transcriptional regulator
LNETDPLDRRADALRNRETLLEAATRAFVTSDGQPSMRAIARDAGVGIATLYRHFPTRESLVDAVYKDQVHRLTEGARDLLLRFPPSEALRRWMDLFADWLATKRGMADTLLAMIDAGDISQAHTRDELLAAVEQIIEQGRATAMLRPETNAEDVCAFLLSVFSVLGAPAQRAQAGRLMDVFMDGLKSRR